MPENDDNESLRKRYTKEMNLEFWGLKYDDEGLEWFKIGRYAL